MYKYIENLRKGPDHHKRRFTLVATSAITGAIFLAWLSVLFPQNVSTVVADSQQSQVSDQVTPIGTLEASVGQAFGAIKSLFDNTTKTVTDVNLQDQYSKMKDQVQSGQIQLTPQNP
jgi:Trk-type K+ transport system membrane component